VTAGVELRPFDPARIGAVVALWNAAAGRAFPLREALFRQNTVLDPHFDAAGAALAHEPATGRVVGCGIAKVARVPLGADGLRPDRGWLSFLVVHPEHRRQGIGAALVRAAEAFLRAKERPTAVLGGDPAHFFPGVPDDTGASGFFEAQGYALRGEAYDLRRSLRGYRTPEPVAAALRDNPGVEIRPLARGEEGALLAFLDATFPGRWRYTVARFLDGGGPIGDVMGVVRSGEVCGFALLFHPHSRWIGPSIAWTAPAGAEGARTGGLGPMGLSPALRGRGLGLALLDRAIVHLASRGMQEMVVDWTILLDFYGTLGFTPYRRYRHGERSL
jgi:predicted N-acetyltransferase YhbS